VRQAEAALWSTPPELRAWEWGLLLSLCHRDLVVLEGHSEALLAAAFAPAGDRVLTAGHDNLILVWDLATRGKVATLHTEAVPIVAAVFSGDGKRVLALTRDGGLRAWDLKTMQEQRRPLLPAAAAGSTALALSPDGMYAGAAEPGRIRVWDTETGQERVPLPSADSQAVQALAFSPLGRWIAALHRGGAISLCSLKDPAERLNLKPPPHAPGGSWIALSPDGQGVAVPGAGNTVLILHARRGEVLATLRGHAEPAVGAAFSQDGRWIVTAGRDKTARLWDARSGSEHLLLAGHSAGLLAAGLTPEADRALTAGEDSVARVWDARTAEALLTFRAQAAGIAAALLAADGKRAYLATADGMVKVWDTQLGRELETYSCGEAPPSALALSPDGRHLLCAGRTSVHVRSAQTGENQKTWLHDVEGIRTATFSPDGTRVALGGREASLWDARDGRKLADLTGHSGQVSCAVFAPDGQALLTGDRGGATLWDVPAGTVRMRLGGRATAVSAAAFSPDGKRILTGGQRMLRVWDAAGGRELLALEAHKSWIGCLSFCADGRHVITGADDGQGKIWFSFDPATTAAGIEERKAVLYRERAERR
jgi:WD40 repeat protein